MKRIAHFLLVLLATSVWTEKWWPAALLHTAAPAAAQDDFVPIGLAYRKQLLSKVSASRPTGANPPNWASHGRSAAPVPPPSPRREFAWVERDLVYEFMSLQL
jgi:hypothetical protein